MNKSESSRENKTRKFPRLARGFICPRVIDSFDHKGYVLVSWLPVCWEETVGFYFSKPSTFWIVCQELIFIQMSIHSTRKLWLHRILFEEGGRWLRSSMQEIISRWHSKVRFHRCNAFIELLNVTETSPFYVVSFPPISSRICLPSHH